MYIQYAGNITVGRGCVLVVIVVALCKIDSGRRRAHYYYYYYYDYDYYYYYYQLSLNLKIYIKIITYLLEFSQNNLFSYRGCFEDGTRRVLSF